MEEQNRKKRGFRSQAPMGEEQPELADVVHRNIKSLLEVRREFSRRRTMQDRIADRITCFSGSMRFVFLHAVIFGGWLVLNSQPVAKLIPGLKPWDPFPFVMLAMIASVEAIFLSTFVLISQNRAAALAVKREEL